MTADDNSKPIRAPSGAEIRRELDRLLARYGLTLADAYAYFSRPPSGR